MYACPRCTFSAAQVFRHSRPTAQGEWWWRWLEFVQSYTKFLQEHTFLWHPVLVTLYFVKKIMLFGSHCLRSTRWGCATFYLPTFYPRLFTPDFLPPHFFTHAFLPPHFFTPAFLPPFFTLCLAQNKLEPIWCEIKYFIKLKSSSLNYTIICLNNLFKHTVYTICLRQLANHVIKCDSTKG